MTEHERAEADEVPYTSPQPSTLRAVVEEFVTRDTTDDGERECTLDGKGGDVMQQLPRARRRWCSTRRQAR